MVGFIEFDVLILENVYIVYCDPIVSANSMPDIRLQKNYENKYEKLQKLHFYVKLLVLIGRESLAIPLT